LDVNPGPGAEPLGVRVCAAGEVEDGCAEIEREFGPRWDGPRGWGRVVEVERGMEGMVFELAGEETDGRE
jgi:hypothetical protein